MSADSWASSRLWNSILFHLMHYRYGAWAGNLRGEKVSFESTEEVWWHVMQVTAEVLIIEYVTSWRRYFTGCTSFELSYDIRYSSRNYLCSSLIDVTAPVKFTKPDVVFLPWQFKAECEFAAGFCKRDMCIQPVLCTAKRSRSGWMNCNCAVVGDVPDYLARVYHSNVKRSA